MKKIMLYTVLARGDRYPFVLRPRHISLKYIFFLNFAYNFIENVSFFTTGNFLKRIFRVTHENLSVFLCYQSQNAFKKNQKLVMYVTREEHVSVPYFWKNIFKWYWKGFVPYFMRLWLFPNVDLWLRRSSQNL